MSNNNIARVLVTGATGFVGGAVVERLVHEELPVSITVRRAAIERVGVRAFPIGDLGPATDWTAALQGCDTVVHCSARVHVMRDTADDPLAAYRVANVEGTMALAKQAVAAGVRRFIFISTIKVNGEGTILGQPYHADDHPAPADPYAISKFEAERELQSLAASGAFELVIIRPPLVYGPGVKANFLRMAQLMVLGVPLPLGSVEKNRRSFVALDNLTDLIFICLGHPAAAGQVFLVSDGEDLSTAELLRRTARALGVPPRLPRLPSSLLSMGAILLARPDLWQRLGGTLQVDITTTRERLGWNPPVTVDQGLRAAVKDMRVGVTSR